MNFLRKFFIKQQSDDLTNSSAQMIPHKVNCTVHIIEPNKKDSMFPTFVIVQLLPEGLGLSFDSMKAKGLDSFTKPAVIGEYHWLNSENSIQPFVMSYKYIKKIACHFYETKRNMTSYVSKTEKILKALPEGNELRIFFEYHNKAKSTKLSVEFRLVDANQETDNRSTCEMYNAMIRAK